jgi:hypothetical protein
MSGETVAAKPRWRPHTHAASGRPKHRYDSAEAAWATAKKIADEDLDKGVWRRCPTAYECPECAGWHVGNWSDEAWRNRPDA